MDVIRNDGIGEELDAGAASRQKILQLSVIDDVDGPVIFRQPFNKMCTTFDC